MQKISESEIIQSGKKHKILFNNITTPWLDSKDIEKHTNDKIYKRKNIYITRTRERKKPAPASPD